MPITPVMLNLFQHPSCQPAQVERDEKWTLERSDGFAVKQVQGDENGENRL